VPLLKSAHRLEIFSYNCPLLIEADAAVFAKIAKIAKIAEWSGVAALWSCGQRLACAFGGRGHHKTASK
jgi:hypothetical protein